MCVILVGWLSTTAYNWWLVELGSTFYSLDDVTTSKWLGRPSGSDRLIDDDFAPKRRQGRTKNLLPLIQITQTWKQRAHNTISLSWSEKLLPRLQVQPNASGKHVSWTSVSNIFFVCFLSVRNRQCIVPIWFLNNALGNKNNESNQSILSW